MNENTQRFVNNVSQSQLIDLDTGELITTINPGDRVRVTRKESIESFTKIQEEYIELNKGRNFVKQFPDISERLCSTLSGNELWLFTFLMPFVGTNSGVLKLRNGVAVDRKILVGLCRENMSKSAIYRAVDGLIAKGVLGMCYVGDERYYVMNPHVCQRGSRANATLLTLFRNTEWVKQEDRK